MAPKKYVNTFIPLKSVLHISPWPTGGILLYLQLIPFSHTHLYFLNHLKSFFLNNLCFFFLLHYAPLYGKM